MEVLNEPRLSTDAIAYLIYHVVLPPKLPQENDCDAQHEALLLNAVIHALRALQDEVEDQGTKAVVGSGIISMETLRNSRDPYGNVSEHQLLEIFHELQHASDEMTVPLEIKAQNAGLLVRRCDKDIIFEAFELSPVNHAVMRSTGRLIREFPGVASRIPVEIMQDDAFRKSLAYTIAKMTTQAAPGTQPQVMKHGQLINENRDTTHPMVVTEWLINYIAAVGNSTTAVRISKNTREDVLWNHSYLPWRRSATWLLIRVTLQLLFSRQEVIARPLHGLYKAFVVQLLLFILDSSKQNWKSLGSESVYMIHAKISRRLRKLENLGQLKLLRPQWTINIKNHMIDAFNVINENWTSLSNSPEFNVEIKSLYHLKHDTNLDISMPEVDTFLNSMLSEQQHTVAAELTPSEKFPSVPADEENPPSVRGTSRPYVYFELSAFETWVEKHLDAWLMPNLGNPHTCGKLRDTIQSYHSTATSAYEGLPCGYSVMYLTVLELWIACDKSACEIFPLLRDYSPEVDLKLLQCLILPFKSQMQRLLKIEIYVQSRISACIPKNPSVFLGFDNASSFAVQYFDQSLRLQIKRKNIENVALIDRAEKLRQLNNLKAEYKKLMEDYNSSTCDTYPAVVHDNYGYTENKHRLDCQRCQRKRTAESLSIDIYEWPLPSKESAAKATIFELFIPEVYSNWRDITMHVVTDVLGYQNTRNEEPTFTYTLDKHAGLKEMLAPSYHNRRIILLSIGKPHCVSHRKVKTDIPNVEENDVCLSNGLRYEYFDAKLNIHTSPLMYSEAIARNCMHIMPNDQSRLLEHFIYRPPSSPDGPPPNQVIERLSDCPPNMSIEEFKAFCTLSFGRNIIYLNILTQLAAPTIDFSKAETQSLLQQIIGQTGTRDDDNPRRVNHRILEKPSFGHAMLDELENSLSRTKENWELWRASASFVSLALRILSLTSSTYVQNRCLLFLMEARSIGMEWLHRLKRRVAASSDQNQRNDLLSRVTEVALMCVSTFNVETNFHGRVLEQPSATSTLIQCCIIIHEYGQYVKSEALDLYDTMIHSWMCLMYRIYPSLSSYLLENDITGLNAAVQENWSAFRANPQDRWTTLSRECCHWLWTRSDSLAIYFNLLTGELLVNGAPLGRLPSKYVKHPMYKLLFKNSGIEVVPTDRPGLEFSARSTYQNHELYFGMKHNDIQIQATKENYTLHLLPFRLFHNYVPYAFVDNYIHWYNHDKEEIWFRDRKDPWSSAASGWTLVRSGLKWRLVNGENILAAMTSPLARTLSITFRNLEDHQHIHTVLNTKSRIIMIDLPRLKLDFFIQPREYEIRSRQYRDMIVDTDQTIGVLVGLKSKLLLKSLKELQPRLLLIPKPRTYKPDGFKYFRAYDRSHVLIEVNKNQAHGVYAYSVRDFPEALLDSGDMQGKLYLAFLHALSSHCLPDLLTRRTGTESALLILKSASIRSFESLTADNTDMLKQIAAISPLRSFYPEYLMDMQKVHWNSDLPSLAQHPQLRQCVEDITYHAMRMSFFFPNSVSDTSTWKSTHPHLEARDTIRSSTFRVCNFGGELFISGNDAIYDARDTRSLSDRGSRAYIAVKMILRDETATHSPIKNLHGSLLKTHFQQNRIESVQDSFVATSLRFDSEWLAHFSSHLRAHWCSFYQTLPTASRTCNQYDIAAWISTMAFAESADMDAIQTIVALYRAQPPSLSSCSSAFDLKEGYTYDTAKIRAIARAHTVPFSSSQGAKLAKTKVESDNMKRLFLIRQDGMVQKLALHLEKRWCRENPPMPAGLESYISVNSALAEATRCFEVWCHNLLFVNHLASLAVFMEAQTVIPVSSPTYAVTAPIKREKLNDSLKFFSVDKIFKNDLVSQSPASTFSPPAEPAFPIQDTRRLTSHDPAKTHLEDLFQCLESLAKSKREKLYVESLRMSCASLGGVESQNLKIDSPYFKDTFPDLLKKYFVDSKLYLREFERSLSHAIKNNGAISDWIGIHVQHSPRISTAFWLSQLHGDNFHQLSDAWKNTIIEYGLAVTRFQRAQRLLMLRNSPADFLEELGNIGHSNWQPRDFPETLLMEAESGFLVRAEQETIASHMRESDKNIVLQLLMGGGKSSVVVPILATHWSDKKRLVRVIVGKPQSRQMLQTLVAKLGNLLGRRVYHLPFCRTMKPSKRDAMLVRDLVEECIATRGILLMQPENILSFRLMAVESALERRDCALSLLDTQQFFEDMSQDIVDESDENFSVKFELTYTMGIQRPIELSPQRWRFIQTILGLTPRFATQVKATLPDSIEVRCHNDGRYPRIRILRSDAADMLLLLIAKEIIEFGVAGLPTSSQSPAAQTALLQYITESDPEPETIQMVELSSFWTSSTKPLLLLLRGLIAGGILRFGLSSKRWRVNFGLDPTRQPSTSLAVPYRSKDNPSPRSEFSHPDVAILLTLLSYYYGGLTDEQLFESLAHLQKSDQALIEYKEWVDTASSYLPLAFRKLSGISTKDRHQCVREVFPNLRYSKNAVDYYLSSIVFPKAMKEFPQKLSASGWDIGAIKSNPLTGFSGTNDTQHLLPLTVEHVDLPSQNHTNALVLQYLLRSENSVELLPPQADRTDAEHLISTVVTMKPEVRVILDCGASILEQNNQQVANTWLKLRDNAIQAIVFFENEELSVLDRTGKIEPLQISPFMSKLNVCLVYLDEAHTRGTDLKLPRNYRAAVTLGQGLTKDKLTQGCMRMRKLGYGQSVVFMVSDEIATRVRTTTCMNVETAIEVKDVLCWSVGETWQDLKQSMPHWAVQGERFERTKSLLRGEETVMQDIEQFPEDEAQTLEMQHRPRHTEGLTGHSESWDTSNPNITKIIQRCRDFEAMVFGTVALSEEQERELAPEIEEEREIEQSSRLPAREHRVHGDVLDMVRRAYIPSDSDYILPAFQALSFTSAGKIFPLEQFPTDLLATSDFIHTSEVPDNLLNSTYILDSYQRSVQFVLSIPDSDANSTRKHLVLISPYEANRVMNIIQTAKSTLHLFAPRTSSGFKSLDKLELYNCGLEFHSDQVPCSLTMQLNLFAGSLYFRSFGEYSEMCGFLGLSCQKPREDQQINSDGFIYPSESIWGLAESPIPFLRMLLMRIRHGGQGLEKTHLGKLLSGIRMKEDDFE